MSVASLKSTSYQPGSGAMAASSSPTTWRQALPIFLAHGSPRILLAASSGSLAYRLWLGNFSLWDSVPIVALLVLWPIQEWLIHVFILHFRPFEIRGHNVDFRVPRSHRRHHQDPWNFEILFIPMHSFIYSAPIVLAVWYLAMPTTELMWTGIAAHFLLALHYEIVHFLVHTRVRPRTRYYERLWENHRLHHFKNENYWFGVTRTEGDLLIGTSPEKRDVPTSPTCKDLLGERE